MPKSKLKYTPYALSAAPAMSAQATTWKLPVLPRSQCNPIATETLPLPRQSIEKLPKPHFKPKTFASVLDSAPMQPLASHHTTFSIQDTHPARPSGMKLRGNESPKKYLDKEVERVIPISNSTKIIIQQATDWTAGQNLSSNNSWEGASWTIGQKSNYSSNSSEAGNWLAGQDSNPGITGENQNVWISEASPAPDHTSKPYKYNLMPAAPKSRSQHFTLFPNLPSELQAKIWDFAAREPDQHLIQIKPHKAIVRDNNDFTYMVDGFKFVSISKAPALTRTCYNARAAALAFRPASFGTCTSDPLIYINFEYDSITFDSMGNTTALSDIMHQIGEHELQQIERLSLRFTDYVDRDRIFGNWMYYIKKFPLLKLLQLYIGEDQVVDEGVNRHYESEIDLFFAMEPMEIRAKMKKSHKIYLSNLGPDDERMQWVAPRIKLTWWPMLVRGKSMAACSKGKAVPLLFPPLSEGHERW